MNLNKNETELWADDNINRIKGNLNPVTHTKKNERASSEKSEFESVPVKHIWNESWVETKTLIKKGVKQGHKGNLNPKTIQKQGTKFLDRSL